MGNDKNRIVIDRSYIDNFSVKKFTEENLIEKYFSNIDVSLRSVGMVGFTTEQISNISEDLFNTATVLFRETFPNRAQIPESLYSHAAIFQLSNAFSSAASCNFLVVLEEEAIIKNMINNYDKETGIYSFFIDKNTIISVENIPFVIDYDVEIRVVKKILNDKTEDYIFSASYVIPENFKSTMSASNANNDPYIKIRRSADGYIALELRCHQCVRNIITEDIVNTNSINYPIIDVPFDGKLAGFDIRYKTSSEDDSGYKQLQSLVVYSQPIEEPFCYYQLKDENTLRITFNTKDEYFTPEYGSTLEITTYTTLGAEGNFDVYTGNEIAVITNDERYTYTTPYLTAAKPLTASTGGRDQLSLDELQSLTVMSYRTATALTTDADLQEYFYNYKSLYSNSEIMFIKKRDDIYERIYSAFIIMKNAEYIYKTNTLSLDLNLSDMENPEKTIYMIHPGTLFTVDSEKFGYADFFRDDELKVQNEQWYREYLIEKKNHNVPYIDDDYDPSDLPDYLRDRQASFAEYKKRKGYKDKVTIFDYDTEAKLLSLSKYDNPHDSTNGCMCQCDDCEHTPAKSNNKFLYVNPFLIRFKKNPNLVSMYMTYINQISTVDYTYKYDDSYIQFILYQLKLRREFSKDQKYTLSTKLLPSTTISTDYPIINAIVKENPYGDDEVEYEFDNPYNTMNNDLRVFVAISDGKKNVCYIELYPTESSDSVEEGAFEFKSDFFTDDHITTDGRLRILDNSVYRRLVYQQCFYTAMHALLVVENNYPNTIDEAIERYGEDNIDKEKFKPFDPNTMIHESDILVDLPNMKGRGATVETPEEGYVYVNITLSKDYYKVDNKDFTKYYHYDENDIIYTDDVGDPIEYSIDIITEMVNNNIIRKWSQVINLSSNSEILIPMEDVVCTIYTAYRRKYNENTKKLEIVDINVDPLYDYDKDISVKLKDILYGNSIVDPTLFDTDIERYFITNEYKTASDPLTFLKPLNNVRANLIFKDYTLNKKVVDEHGDITYEFINDIMDVNINNIPFIRWNEVLDDEKRDYFMSSFLAQYENLIDIINTKLRNETSFDIKFYNTYGRSKNFTIGEDGECLDTVNLLLTFDIWYTPGTDLLSATPSVKEFIKNEIETINSQGVNNLYISNLMRKIESNFAYVDHIRFKNINHYDANYQAVKTYTTDLTELTVSERREYVPEFLVIETEDIVINEYFSS